ncbi:unnamed protein product [Brassicogethes aeneus]|uniref:protein-tyrosine-phosphatase n=1 Tax=Brassicogethes aeneus TaxID=1431903 RepID=A0A9P0FNH7_BRAAE|nr:unnamed protein product [Brassicogethes aeneus]
MLVNFLLFSSIFVLLRAQIYPPTDLTAENIDPTTFILKWLPPDDLENYTYTITINMTNPTSYIPEECSNSQDVVFMTTHTKNKNYTYSKANTDYNIEVFLSARNLEGDSSEPVNITFSTMEGISGEVTNVVYQNLTTIGKDNVNLNGNITWLYPCTPNGLPSFNIRLNGLYTEDHNLTDIHNIPVDNLESYQQFVGLDGLLKYSFRYTAEIFAVTSKGANGGVTLTFLTDPNYPDEPKMLNIKDTGTEMEIHWEEPENKMGKILNYYVQIKSLGPIEGSYDCNADFGTTNYKTTTKTLKIPTRPYYTYNITIQGETEIGRGKTKSEIYKTRAIAPPLPSSVNITDSTDVTEDEVILDFKLSFVYPCATNGILNYTIELRGQYTDDDDEHTSTEIPWESDISYITREKIIDISEFLSYSYYYELIIYSNDTIFITTNFNTSDNYPNEPVLNISDNGIELDLAWEEPPKRMGKIIFYDLEIAPLGVKENALDCDPFKSSTNIQTSNYKYKMNIRSYYDYNVTIRGNTSVGWGKAYNTIYSTQKQKPDSTNKLECEIRNFSDGDEYNVEAYINFGRPCRTNGPFENYEITYTGTRKNYNNHEKTVLLDRFNSNSYNFNLKPEFYYNISVKVNNDEFASNLVQASIAAPPGVPKQNNSLSVELRVSSSKAILTLSRKYFSDENGDNLYYAIILSNEKIGSAETFTLWDNETWPELKDSEVYVTEDFWRPFEDEDVESIDVEITKNITENTKYYMVIRAFTGIAFRDSKIIEFHTTVADVGSNLGLILGLSIGLGFALVAFIGVTLYYLRKHKFCFRKGKFSTVVTSARDIYPKFRVINDKELAEEFYNLNITSSSIKKSKDVGVQPGNQKKNRYKNILPYDSTRVKLLRNGEDFINDYINASYIQGYTGNVEYIASQGPLSETCADFWKMVINENVTVIAQAAAFVENGSTKCYKYFPEVGEYQDEDDVSIKTLSKINMEYYCTRQIQIQCDKKEKTVTHLQFLYWPDFGVPENTECVINFCQELRRHKKTGMILIHCSAGVGRTGTLISFDIAMQAVHAKKEVNIEEIVLHLRHQRPQMVQSEGQYIFIHKCVADYIKKLDR